MSEGTHSYYDWQVSTLMLAYDVVQPLRRDDDDGLAARQQACERELREIALSIIPAEVQADATRELPPEVVYALTRATIARAAAILADPPASR